MHKKDPVGFTEMQTVHIGCSNTKPKFVTCYKPPSRGHRMAKI